MAPVDDDPEATGAIERDIVPTGEDSTVAPLRTPS
eukprot:SAG31_NODE_1079_length_10031_cov_5.270741_12_plen_34_part_01